MSVLSPLLPPLHQMEQILMMGGSEGRDGREGRDDREGRDGREGKERLSMSGDQGQTVATEGLNVGRELLLLVHPHDGCEIN